MYSYPSVNLGTLEVRDWEKLLELAEKKGKPYAAREETIVLLVRRKDWLFAICKMYRKGVWELTLNAIMNPWKKPDKLREIKEKEWRWAEEKCRELLEEFRG